MNKQVSTLGSLNSQQKTNQQSSNQQINKSTIFKSLNLESLNLKSSNPQIFKSTKNKPVCRPAGDRSTKNKEQINKSTKKKNRNPHYSNSYYNPKKHLSLLKILGQWKSSTTEIQKLPY